MIGRVDMSDQYRHHLRLYWSDGIVTASPAAETDRQPGLVNAG
ncbi:MAG TPA: hypothetical protein VI727_04550 [Candidatus Brocadiaceae bacterium]|nr:hypothetical protein [Candidatus Brocadiaceae bacterium]